MFCVTLIFFIRLSVKDCSGEPDDGTSGGNANENARCLADAEDCDKCHKENGGNVKKGLHCCLILNF